MGVLWLSVVVRPVVPSSRSTSRSSFVGYERRGFRQNATGRASVRGQGKTVSSSHPSSRILLPGLAGVSDIC